MTDSKKGGVSGWAMGEGDGNGNGKQKHAKIVVRVDLAFLGKRSTS